jgi:hydrogenase maturation protease
MPSSDERYRVLVVGYGNSLRRDDGAGWFAAERLDDLLPADSVRVLVRNQLTPELAETVSQVELVVLIDASCTDPPGHIAQREVQPAADTTLSLLHEVNPSQLLGTAVQLYGRCARALLFSIGGRDFEMGEGLSPEVAAAVDEVVNRVQLLIRGPREGEAPAERS